MQILDRSEPIRVRIHEVDSTRGLFEPARGCIPSVARTAVQTSNEPQPIQAHPGCSLIRAPAPKNSIPGGQRSTGTTPEPPRDRVMDN
jgi:hypothetical protein